jgi:hypothetical protein
LPLLCTLGCGKQNAVGWWLSLLADGVIAAVFVYAGVDDARYRMLDGAPAGTTTMTILCQ